MNAVVCSLFSLFI